jgi:hypothetical protein
MKHALIMKSRDKNLKAEGFDKSTTMIDFDTVRLHLSIIIQNSHLFNASPLLVSYILQMQKYSHRIYSRHIGDHMKIAHT